MDRSANIRKSGDVGVKSPAYQPIKEHANGKPTPATPVERSSVSAEGNFGGLHRLFGELMSSKQNGREITEAEPKEIEEYGEQIIPLKQEMSRYFRTGGHIQLLSEEAFTFKMMDRTLAHPDLKKEYLDMLHEDVPEAHRLSAGYVTLQTARAFLYSQEYLRLLWDSGVTPDSFKEGTIQVDVARQAINEVKMMKGDIFEAPHEFVFLDTPHPEDSRKNMPRIKVGRTLPREEWQPVRAVVQENIHDVLKEFDLQRRVPSAWALRNDRSHTRYVLKLSSFQLSYQGHALESLEQIEYSAAPKKYIRDLSTPQLQLIEDPSLVRPTHIISRITTNDEGIVYYGPPVELTKAKEDVGFQVLKHLLPYISGAHYEKDTTRWRPGKGKVSDAFWQNKDMDWHIPADDRYIYHTEIYPTIDRHVGDIVQYLNQKEVTILDMAGGNGDLAERIIKNLHAKDSELVIKYRIVDYSEDDVAIANERFSELKRRIETLDAVAVCRDVLEYDYDAERMKADPQIGLPAEGVNILINSGGLLNSSITRNDLDEEMSVPKRSNRMNAGLINDHGFYICSGLSPLGVNAEDHRKNGLKVRNLHNLKTNRQLQILYKGHPELEDDYPSL